MTAITKHEEDQINAANASGLAPVVFVHGLWLLAGSWDRWRTVFEEAGYTTLAPDWPDDAATLEALPVMDSPVGRVTYAPPGGELTRTPAHYAHGPVIPGAHPPAWW